MITLLPLLPKEVAYLRSIYVVIFLAQMLTFKALRSTNEVLGVRVCLERFGRCGFGSVNLAEPINPVFGAFATEHKRFGQ